MRPKSLSLFRNDRQVRQVESQRDRERERVCGPSGEKSVIEKTRHQPFCLFFFDFFSPSSLSRVGRPFFFQKRERVSSSASFFRLVSRLMALLSLSLSLSFSPSLISLNSSLTVAHQYIYNVYYKPYKRIGRFGSSFFAISLSLSVSSSSSSRCHACLRRCSTLDDASRGDVISLLEKESSLSPNRCFFAVKFRARKQKPAHAEERERASRSQT